MFDFDRDNEDEDYTAIEGYYDPEDKVYVLTGKQLRKIFESTNFNDIGSMRYLYKYVERRGGIRQLRKLGLKEGDTVRIEDYEFEYVED
jgi:GTP-binding protein